MFGQTGRELGEGPVDRRQLTLPAAVRSAPRAAHTSHPVGRATETTEEDAPDAGGGSRLDRLIAHSVARFLAIDADVIDEAIADYLRKTVAVLRLDRAISWIPAADPASTATCHVWTDAAPPSAPRASAALPLPCIAPDLPAGETRHFTSIDELPAGVDREACLRCDLSSAVVVSVAAAGSSTGARAIFAFGSSVRHDWTRTTIERLQIVATVIGGTLTRQAAAPAHVHGERCADDLRRPDLADHLVKDSIIGRSKALLRVLDQIQQVAATDSTVLLLGETGVGKEILATHLHALSARRGRAMVRVNCAAIPSTLIESELFGRERGAFTGSLARQIGRFELADHSSIFLDEIGDLPSEVQVKLLRVLEERQIERLGSPQSIKVDVRIIAATHRKLEERIADGAFREDLFYRLNVFPIQVPPLRERREDIVSLVWLFVDEFSRSFAKRIDAIPRRDMDALQRYPWPGNIRELRNVVERAMIVATGPRLAIALPARSDVGQAAKRSLKMVDVEKDHVRTVLESTGWRIRGTNGAAELLGLQPTTLETRMLKLGLVRPRP
jgi:formate hydrogenlyase transcriptional activator